jgi:hypothetical protein
MNDPNAGAGAAMPFAYQDVANANSANPAMSGMQDTAQGAYLNSNPYLDQMFGAQTDAMTRAYQEATAPTTAAGFSGANRLRGGGAAGGGYNSAVGRNEGELMRGLENTASNVYGNNYNQERQNQEQARRDLSGAWNQGLGAQQSATGNLAGVGNQGFNNQFGAAGELGNQFFGGQQQQLNAAGQGMGFAQQDYTNLQNLYNAGQTQQAQGDRELSDQQRISDFYNTGAGNPWANFQNMYNPMLQAGQLGQQGTTSSTQQYQPGGLDYLSAAANIGGMAMGVPGVGNLFGGGGTQMAGTTGYTPGELRNLQAVM